MLFTSPGAHLDEQIGTRCAAPCRPHDAASEISRRSGPTANSKGHASAGARTSGASGFLSNVESVSADGSPCRGNINCRFLITKIEKGCTLGSTATGENIGRRAARLPASVAPRGLATTNSHRPPARGAPATSGGVASARARDGCPSRAPSSARIGEEERRDHDRKKTSAKIARLAAGALLFTVGSRHRRVGDRLRRHNRVSRDDDEVHRGR